MDKELAPIAIGDPVEVRFWKLEGGRFLEDWGPAIVTLVVPGWIGVAYADGRRDALRRGDGIWRAVR